MNMRRFTALLVCVLCIVSVLQGQQRITIVAKGETTLESALPAEMLYAFDGFKDARLIQKNGNENDTRININLITKDILFLTKGNQILVFAFPEELEKIIIGDREWIPVDGNYGEVIVKDNSKALVRVKNTRITDTRKEGGFGFASSTSSVTSVTSFVSDVGKIGAPLAVGEYDFETTTLIKLLVGGKTINADANGFKKAFPEKKKAITSYLKTNRINFKDDAEVIDFMKKCISM